MFGWSLDTAGREPALPVRRLAAAVLGSTLVLASLAGAEEGVAITAGDTLSFDILDDDRDPVEVRVGEDGAVQLPFIGSVSVAGLPIPEARGAVEYAYRSGGIFTEPRIALSIASYRPVFVVGDVRTPGSYPYIPRLTVQMAIALAGGDASAAGTLQDQVLARAQLRGTLEEIEADLPSKILTVARIKAFLAGRRTISEDDVTPAARSFLSHPATAILRRIEEQMLVSALDGAEESQRMLAEGVAEAERGLALFDELIKKQQANIRYSREELDRARQLQKRGIKSLTEVAEVQRVLGSEEAQLLQIYAGLSSAKREIGVLKRQVSDLRNARRTSALTDLQAATVALNAALATHAATEEQAMLMASLAVENQNLEAERTVELRVRRPVQGGMEEIVADLDTPLRPGDVVAVTIARPQSRLARLDPTMTGAVGPSPAPGRDARPEPSVAPAMAAPAPTTAPAATAVGQSEGPLAAEAPGAPAPVRQARLQGSAAAAPGRLVEPAAAADPVGTDAAAAPGVAAVIDPDLPPMTAEMQRMRLLTPAATPLPPVRPTPGGELP